MTTEHKITAAANIASAVHMLAPSTSKRERQAEHAETRAREAAAYAAMVASTEKR
ncbi:hypothetical protein SAMN03159463_05466 [Mesorhizobium sp. NFR06]|uniref:hypothetical protein n=1 Tax=Mesorhizobium sp. NFR06 TaxID=1566290 RepID=UPI0008E94E1A|nr:hypothetical protein [Mesorhizobium sp. NFR06]SFQ04422.1 hypothetical protein SAMN03159463_05466 [Mesorhizobium sp. NFR06]